MQISISCPNCGKKYQVDAKLGGRRVKCKACGQAIAIPAREELELPDAAPLPPMPVPSIHESSHPAPPAPVPRPPASPIPVAYEAPDEDRDARNFRINTPHSNSVFAGLESSFIFLAQAFFYFAFAIACLFSIWVVCVALGAAVQGKQVAAGRVAALAIFPPLYFGFIYFVLASLNVLAASLAGKALMFHLPAEDNRWRLMGASLAAMLPQILIFAILFPLFWAREHSMSEGFYEGYFRSSYLTLFLFPFNIALHFLFTWLLLRLKFLEALLAWLFTLIMNVLIWMVITFVLFLVALALR